MAEEIEVIVEEEKEEAHRIEEQAEEPARDQLDECIQHLQRLKAEFDNYRKRVERERRELEDRVKGDFCKQLLPILDDLERALVHTAQSQEALSAGLQLVHKNLWLLLEREGLSRVPAVGQVFDPHIHEAVMVEPDHRGQGQLVTEEIQRGYLHKGRLLRPAKVKVSQGLGSRGSGFENCGS